MDSTPGTNGAGRALLRWPGAIAFGRSLLGADDSAALRSGPVRIGIPVALLVVGFVVALFRLQISSWNQLWAEDGSVFLSGAYSGNPLVVLEPSAGYLHLYPRIAAWLSSIMAPLETVPVVITIFGALLTTGVATAVYLFARERLSSPVLPVVLWLEVVVLPIAGGEVANSIANSHWYLGFGAVIAALVTPRSRGLLVLQAVVIAVAVLSDPLAALLVAPLIAVRVLTLHRGRENAASWVFGGAALIQGVFSVVSTLVHHERAFSPIYPTIADFMSLFGIRVVSGSVAGVSGTWSLVSHLGKGSILALAITVTLFLIASALLSRRYRWVIVALVAASVGLAAIEFTLTWDGVGAGGLFNLEVGGRYMVIPVLLLVAAFCFGLDSLTTWLAQRRRLLALGPALLLALIVITHGVNDYRVWDARSQAEDWPVALRQALAECDSPDDVAVPAIAPWGFDGPRLSCEFVKESLDG